MLAESSEHQNIRGLSSAEAQSRLRQYGENTVVTKKKLRPLTAFVKKFNSPLLLILMAVSLISFVMGNRTNAIILIFMVLLSVTLDFVNTYRSQKAVDELASRVVTTTTVIRNGKKQEIDLKEVVPGDILSLSAGDVLPADCRVIECRDLFINQSALTGESVPVEKSPDIKSANNKKLSLDQTDAVFMGTSVVTGYATVEVMSTGRQTEFGRIAERLSQEEQDTDFERNIKKFSTFVMRLTIIMVSFVFIINLLSHRGWLDSFTFAIAIAIGLTPELLPVIMSVSLSRGAIRMAKKGVIVKHLPAIQNFGRMNVLCTDKTGTLTENRITVMKYVDAFGKVSDDVLHIAYVSSFFHTGVSNPLDKAIRDYKSWEMQGVTKIDEIPFDFERRRESIVSGANGSQQLTTKGAPEAIFPICTTYNAQGKTLNVDSKFLEIANKQFQALSSDGFKVLAIAKKDVTGKKHPFEKSEEQGMVFLGFVALLDPPKATASEAIRELEGLGIEFKILTGDNELLTQKICRDLRVPVKGIVLGSHLSTLSDAELQKLVLSTTIFARIDPEQKEKIIALIQKGGQVVGYLGDGINDAPALKAADVGISVSNAVDVAKETADIILLRKSLRVLKDGVAEGRKTFRNTLKYILMGMSSNFGNMFSMVAASAFLPFLPMLPTQVLLNNFLYDISQLSLSADTVDPEDVVRPSVWNLKFIRRYMIIFGSISSLFDFITFGVLYLAFSHSQHQFQTGWFIESIATQVFVIYVIRTRKIPFLQSKPSAILMFNTLIAVIIAWALPLMPFAKIFNLQPLPVIFLAAILGIVLVYLVLAEFVKRIFYRKYVEA